MQRLTFQLLKKNYDKIFQLSAMSHGLLYRRKKRAFPANQNYDEALPHKGGTSGENANSERYMHPSVHCSTIYNRQDMETPECPSTDEWIKKMG